MSKGDEKTIRKGKEIIILDGNKIENREQLYEELREQMASDELIGSNLDALYDVLTSQKNPPEIEIRNQEALCAHLGGYGLRLMKMLKDIF